MAKQGTTTKSKDTLVKPVLKGSKVSKTKAKPPAITKVTTAKKDTTKVTKKAAAIQEEFPSSDEEDGSYSSSENEEELGEFQGFESTDDEDSSSSADEHEHEHDDTQEKGISKVPKLSVETQEKVNAVKNIGGKKTAKKGVVYVGRIPHGFYEKQMKAYFSQFGEITRLRLSRNKKTGRSKHYAFVEFETEEVAKVVVDTMDNYLLFGHILQVKLVPSESVHEELFKGANKRFHVVPWKQIAKHKNDQPKTKKQLEKLQEKHDKYKQTTASKLAALGIEYSLETSKPKASPKDASTMKAAAKTRAAKKAGKVAKK